MEASNNVIMFFGGFLSIIGVVLTTIGFKVLMKINGLENGLTSIGKDVVQSLKENNENKLEIKELRLLLQDTDTVVKSHVNQFNYVNKEISRLDLYINRVDVKHTEGISKIESKRGFNSN